MSHLTVCTFGQATVLVDGLEPVWPADSARTLLFYLLCHPEGQPYATILHALWTPEAGQNSMNCLRVAVCRLRAALGHPGSVVTDRNRYRLAQAVLERADTFQFSEGLACAQCSATAQQQLTGYEQALAHYSGDYLPLEDSKWAHQFRGPVARGSGTGGPRAVQAAR